MMHRISAERKDAQHTIWRRHVYASKSTCADDLVKFNEIAEVARATLFSMADFAATDMQCLRFPARYLALLKCRIARVVIL